MGRLELICGPMFSGKTTALIDRLTTEHDAGLEIAAFKPSHDTRYSRDQVVSHNGLAIHAFSIGDLDALPRLVGSAVVIGIDEVHFFLPPHVPLCASLVNAGVRIIVAGVELDHRGQPFEVVQEFAAVADQVTRLTARCARCGSAARHSQRLVGGDARIIVGGVGDYEPRCDRCFEPGR